MLKRVLFILIVFTAAATGQDVTCDKIANYRMNVELDIASKTITGTQEIQWRNNSSNAVKEVYFHAYLNAFKNNQSTFLKELMADKSRKELFGADWPQDGWGFLQIKSMDVSLDNKYSRTSLLPTILYVQPDDQNKNDQTVFRVELPAAVNPGETLEFAVEFTAKLPYYGCRAGYVENLYMAGQWFPKIGVLQENGWNCHQYHRNSEFFADFGDYDVTITVPEKFIIGATGVMKDSTNHDGKVTCRFVQNCVHDFAWAASPNFKVTNRTFQRPNLPEVNLRLLYLPGNSNYVSEYLEGAEVALQHFGSWYIPYPYPQLTIIDVPYDSWLGSMEYPTLITVRVDRNSIPGMKVPAWTAIHECGHQFWYGLVANNEVEDAWLDEALVCYSTIRCLDAVYGDLQPGKAYLTSDHFSIPLTFSKITINPLLYTLDSYRTLAQADIMEQNSWSFLSYKSFRAQVYNKGALMLATLENMLGEEVMNKIMHTFASRYAYKHPVPDDFIRTVNEFAPQPLDWFFDQALRSSAVLDYSVRSITSSPETDLYGLDEQNNYVPAAEKEKKSQVYHSEVIIERLGEFICPVDVIITFGDGETVNQVWDGKTNWIKYTFTRKAPVLSAVVDPERKLALDVNYNNNSCYKERKPFAARRWATTWLFWLQDLLEMAAFFA